MQVYELMHALSKKMASTRILVRNMRYEDPTTHEITGIDFANETDAIILEYESDDEDES